MAMALLFFMSPDQEAKEKPAALIKHRFQDQGCEFFMTLEELPILYTKI